MTQDQTPVPAGWHPDPTRRHELRYWDGVAWTDQVSDGGVQSADPVQANVADSIDSALTFGAGPSAEAVQRMVTGDGIRGAGITDAVPQGDGTLWGEPVLVVSQKAKLIEITNQYGVFNQAGTQIGYVTEVGQSALRKAIRLLTKWDQFLTHRFEIRGADGSVQLKITRPGKIFKSTVIVEHPNGGELGRIVQENMIGKIRFGLMINGERVGSINAENWRAWNFTIRDHSETEIAKVTKTWEGLAKAMFTTADNYVVQLLAPIQQPVLSLVVAAALSIDTALKQDS